MTCKGCEAPQYGELLTAKYLALLDADGSLLEVLCRVRNFDGPHVFHGIARTATPPRHYVFVPCKEARVEAPTVWTLPNVADIRPTPGLGISVWFDRCTCWDILAGQLATAAELAGLE